MSWLHDDLTRRTGAPEAIFGLSAYAFDRQKTQHVLFQGFGAGAGDGHVHELWSDGNWHLNDLTSQSGAPPISGQVSGYVYADEPGGWTQHAVFQGLQGGTGPSGRVEEIWWDSGGKNHHELTSGKPRLIDRPFGYTFEHGQHIVYRAENTLRFLDMEEDFGWLDSDLTSRMEGSVPMLPPTAYGFASQKTHHILYTGTDRHVHELWKGPSGGFHHNDLMLAARTTSLSIGIPFGFANDPGNQQVISYAAADGHLHQLRWDGNWQDADLTGTVGGGAPSSSTVPTGYLYASAGTLHVDYLGADDHIHEYVEDDTGWHPDDLTLSAGVALSRSDPASYVSPDNTQHVVFVDVNRHIIELRQRS